jgi:hypothetical protein
MTEKGKLVERWGRKTTGASLVLPVCQPGCQRRRRGIIFQDKFIRWIQDDLLLEIITKEEGTIIGRMLNYLASEKSILVYDVDHKNVFNVHLSEIYQIRPVEK